MDEKIIAELNQAERSREVGNEGMARVCARRAAGLAVRWYVTQIGQARSDLNNFELLSDPSLRDHLPAITHPWLDRLSMRVDTNHELPDGIDLLADAKNVIRLLRNAEQKPMEENKKKIVLYGTTWCGATRRARALLDEENIPYEWIDIDKDEIAAEFVKSVANGYRSVPTIVFPDGTILVEPSSYQLKEKLI